MASAVKILETVDDLKAENGRQRVALEFYALSHNWLVPAPESEHSPVGLDGGDFARAALNAQRRGG